MNKIYIQGENSLIQLSPDLSDYYTKEEIDAINLNIDLSPYALISETQGKITGTAGQFVVIGNDGNVTTKTIPLAEEATFGISLISFTIENTSYQAEEGMTWTEWIESEYNVDGYRIVGDDICSSSSSEPLINDSTKDHQYSSYIILNNEVYTPSFVGLEDNPFI